LLRHKKSNAEAGIGYKTGMALKEAEVEPGVAEPSIGKAKPAKKVPVICASPLCGLKGHKTPVSKKCIHNPMHPHYVPLPPR